MKVDVTDLSPTRKQMAVEIAVEDVAAETESVLKGYRAKASIDGFRKGKAPMSVIKAHFADALKEDVRDRIVGRSFAKAAQDKGLRPLGEPALDELKHEDGEPLTFKTTFDVLPEIKPSGYDKIAVNRPKLELAEGDVDKALEEIRQSRVQLVAEEDRTAEEGDVVFVDIEGEVPGGEPFKREKLPIEIGEKSNLKEFNEQLVGSGPGGKLDFPVTYPEDYGAEHLAGKTVQYRLSVHEVKRKVLPDLDDEFAKDLGEFEDLAALKARVQTDLEERMRQQDQSEVRNAILEKMMIENPVVLPEILVESELRSRLEEMVRKMMMQGMDPEKAEIDWADARKRQEEPARKSVHARLLLDAIAETEQIRVEGEEIEARIAEEAKRVGETVEAIKKRMEEHSGIQALANQIVREKSLDYLTSVATIEYAD